MSKSASNQITNLAAIFSAATNEYQKVTGQRLDTHPFAVQLDACHDPEAVSSILRTQAQAFSEFRRGNERLMAWLGPTVHILHTFSTTLGEVLVRHLIHTIWLLLNTWFSAIFTSKGHLYRYLCSSRGKCLPRLLRIWLK
jgi:hypothetical protein